jgi:hypothetical protein
LQEAHLLVEMGVDPGCRGVVRMGMLMACLGELGEEQSAKALGTASRMSWLVIDSSGLWLMPAFSPRMNSIACGIASCSFIASCPAPLGRR